ncbi:efflux RND transporter periplasmic adaptor subunit [Sphingopyxis terrae]|uniref:efflux RND transporter periplasmic adaptor subunit n=1 Tax=Sphingopyxis terrae TaxID=33052 RepID=UPI0009EF4A25|nr:efflux RND transporter periplasmic adaptor subunit [Sphingopyxis terrae]
MVAPAVVSVVQVAPEPVTVVDELPGRVVAYRIAEIRAQVGGIVQRRLFEQGSEVRAGQALFQINPAPFRAEANIAAATLQRSQAALGRARVQTRRLEPLLGADAISRQAYDDAVTARDQAAADVAQGRAMLERRQLDLGFATIRSPISGRIDQAVLTEGALVGVGDASPLATVQQIDRVYIDVRQPASRLTRLRALARNGTGQGASVEILPPEGSAHPIRGTLLFSGISVDPGTGASVVRVEVQNTGRVLLPGMFVRARLPRETRSNALLVPLQAVQRDGNGGAWIDIVDARKKAARRSVKTGAEIDGRVIVEQGLKPGESVIVEGQDRVQPGAAVRAMPWRGERPGPGRR